VISWVSDKLDWEVTKKIAGSRLVALSALFPFVGYLALLNTEIVAYLQLFVDPSGQSEAIAISRIEEIYFALIWVSIGSILYQLSCPSQIKMFSSRYELIEKEIQIAGPVRLKGIQSEVVSHKASWWMSAPLVKDIEQIEGAHLGESDASKDELFGYASGNPSRGDYLSAVGNSAIELLGVFYDYKRQSRPLLRSSVLLIVGIGYFKLSAPSAKIFWELLTT